MTIKSKLIILTFLLTARVHGQKNSADTLYFAKPSIGEYGFNSGALLKAWGYLIVSTFSGNFNDWRFPNGYKITGGLVKLSNGQINKGAPIGRWTSNYPTGELFEEAEYDTVLTKYERSLNCGQDCFLPEEYKIGYRTKLKYYKRYYKSGNLQEKLISKNDFEIEEISYYNNNGNEYINETRNEKTGYRKFTMYKPDKSIWREYEKKFFIKDIKQTQFNYEETEINYDTKEKTVISVNYQKKTHIVTIYDLSGKQLSKTIQKM